MNRKKRVSLKWQALMAAIVSLAFAVVVFGFLNYFIGNSLIYKSDFLYNYNVKMNNQQLEKFDSFVTTKALPIEDVSLIDSWVKRQFGIDALILVNGNRVIYDSSLYKYNRNNYSEEILDIYKSIDANSFKESGFYSKTIKFENGNIEVYMFGDYSYQLWALAEIGELLIAALVFAISYITIINKKIKYIVQLEHEVKMIETGSLDFEFTEKGHDELSSLAYGLNHMRLALSENILKEEEAAKANYDLVVAISHDLRTPLTSLNLYLDILNANSSLNAQQQESYLHKCQNKVAQIKKMTDQLFERFYLVKEEQKFTSKQKKTKVCFEEPLSNLVSYLEANNFKVQAKLEWINDNLVINDDYINRICDNIASNITKYADKDSMIYINAKKEDEYFCLTFSNKACKPNFNIESNKIGTSNIIDLMENMNGKCIIEIKEGYYYLKLQFLLEE